VERPAGGRDDRVGVAAAHRSTAEDDVDVGLGQAIGHEPLDGVRPERGGDLRVDDVVGADDRRTVGVLVVERVDEPRDEVGPGDEIRSLLLAELVVETVQDEDRDEEQGEPDDPGEAEGEPALEGLRTEPPDAVRDQPRPGAATRGCAGRGGAGRGGRSGRVSVRRMRSRRPGPS
jgi:hypothetical protein